MVLMRALPSLIGELIRSFPYLLPCLAGALVSLGVFVAALVSLPESLPSSSQVIKLVINRTRERLRKRLRKRSRCFRNISVGMAWFASNGLRFGSGVPAANASARVFTGSGCRCV